MSDARRLATGSLAQQAAQITGLVAMFAIVTVLARRLSLAELGVYGLINALAGYLLIVQNAAAGAAVRAMAAADEGRGGGVAGEESTAPTRDRSDAPDSAVGERRAARRAERAESAADRTGPASAAFSTSALIYVAAGAGAGMVIAALGLLLAAVLDLSPELARELRIGAAAAGAVTLVGWPLTVYRDALRARGRLVLAAGAETAGIAAYVALVLALAFADAPLWAIVGAGASIPLMAGIACAVAARAPALPWRLRPRLATRTAAREFLGVAGHISLAEAASAAIYVITRTILGAARSPAAVGLYEGPVRVHNVFRALNGAVMVSVLPTATRFDAAGDARHLHELLVRGCRYALAGIVPLIVVGIVLAGPILEAWLGAGFEEGGTAMAILLSHWLLNGVLGVSAAVLVATGRARYLSRWALLLAGATVVLALALVSPLGIEGIAIATAVPYALLFPYLLRATLRAVPVTPAELARRAFAPAWALGAALAGGLVALRLALDPQSAPALLAIAAAALAAYWLAYYALALGTDERALARGILQRDRSRASGG